jgi:hypothetical protein
MSDGNYSINRPLTTYKSLSQQSQNRQTNHSISAEIMRVIQENRIMLEILAKAGLLETFKQRLKEFES